MKNSFKTILLHSRIQYPARLFLLTIGLALLSAGLATTAFAADDEQLKKYDFRAGYFLCIRDSGGDTETMLKCVKDEQKFQDERLDNNYQAYLKIRSPDDQESVKDVEEDWERERDTFCSFPQGSDHAAKLQRAICFLYRTADKAYEHRIMLEAYQKKRRNEGKRGL